MADGGASEPEPEPGRDPESAPGGGDGEGGGAALFPGLMTTEDEQHLLSADLTDPAAAGYTAARPQNVVFLNQNGRMVRCEYGGAERPYGPL